MEVKRKTVRSWRWSCGDDLLLQGGRWVKMLVYVVGLETSFVGGEGVSDG